jgi:hypothetical protein
LINGAFVGTSNEGQQDQSHVTQLDNVERTAEKPFLVEHNGLWHIAVPRYKTYSSGIGDDTDVDKISMGDVHVARDGDSADSINAAIQGKKALLLTPGFYALEEAIKITDPGFIVLGIGMPTLVANGGSAMIIAESANDVRVAAILIDAGKPVSAWQAPALLHWKGKGGVLSDIFTRVGAFQYERGSKSSCMLTKADTHVQLDGEGTVVDNTWLWHADHDDCYTQSDDCNSGYGLVVNGDDVSVSGLKVEHVFKDHVYWTGENGQMIFLQEELPYHYLSFGSDGNVGYRVDDAVQSHTAYALGIYIVGSCGNMVDVTAIRAPYTASLNNMVGWDNGADVSAFAALLCQGDECTRGACSGSFCRLSDSPQPMPEIGDTVLISSRDNKKCLELKDGEETEGTQVEVSTCDANNQKQHWQYIDNQIRHNTQDGRQLCISDPAEHPLIGDILEAHNCDGSSGQKWTYDHLLGSTAFGAPATKFCMDVVDGSTSDDTPVQIWDCEEYGYKNQRWNARKVHSSAGAFLMV